MQKQSIKIAKIMCLISIFLISIGVFEEYQRYIFIKNNENNTEYTNYIVDTLNKTDNEVEEDSKNDNSNDNAINVEEEDDSKQTNNVPVIDNNSNQTTNNSNNNTNNQTITNNTPSSNSTNNNSNNQTNSNSQTNSVTVTSGESSNSSNETALSISNNALRSSIQDKYGITIKYGTQTDGYQVGGYSVYSLTDESKISVALNSLYYDLSLYPSNMYKEMEDNGFNLTINLINLFSSTSVTGLTANTGKNVVMSIACYYSFDETFHHENYHFMELYITSKGGNYGSWDSLNPTTFTYGNIDSSLSYSTTFLESSYFVNNYAQYSASEDRASTFEYLMATSKASCLNKNTPVWQKSNYMKDTIEYYFNCVSSQTTEYWERFL